MVGAVGKIFAFRPQCAEIIYTKGCVNSFTNWFNENLILIGGLAFGFAFIQVVVKLSVV